MASLDGIEAEDVISEAAGSGCKGIIKVKGGRWQGRVSGIIKGKYIYVPKTFKDLNEAVEARAKFLAEMKAGTRPLPTPKPRAKKGAPSPHTPCALPPCCTPCCTPCTTLCFPCCRGRSGWLRLQH